MLIELRPRPSLKPQFVGLTLVGAALLASLALDPNINSPPHPATIRNVANIITPFSRGGISLLKMNNARNSIKTPVVTAIIDHSEYRDAVSNAALSEGTSISPIGYGY